MMPAVADAAESASARAFRGSAQTKAHALGLPLSLAALADVLPRQFAERPQGEAFAHDWLAAIAPGADLSAIPSLLVAEMLAPFARTGPCGHLAATLVALHGADVEGRSATRAQWAACRRAVLALEDVGLDRREAAVAQLCEAGAWPAASARSALVEVLGARKRIAARTRADGWTDADQARAQATLDAIYDEHGEARVRGETPAYQQIFHEREPVLAAGFERDLAHSNAAFAREGEDFALRCLALLRDPPSAVMVL